MANNKRPHRKQPVTARTNNATLKNDVAASAAAPAKPVDPVKKFIADNPVGSIKEPPEIVANDDGTEREVPAVQDGAPPQTEKPAAEKPAQPEGEKPAEAVAAKPEEKPEEKPAQPEQKPTEQAAAAKPEEKPAEPQAIDYTARIRLDNDTDWSLQEVYDALRERERVRPIVEETMKFRGLFGNHTYEETEKVWKPILETLRDNPTRRMLADLAMKADPGTVQYLLDSKDYYESLPAEERGSSATAEPSKETPVIPIAADPKSADPAVQMLIKRAVDDRAKNDWSVAYERHPWLRNNQKAREALHKAAMRLHREDLAAGKHPLEARGLLEALAEEHVFLEAMAIATNGQRTRATEPAPARGREAPLPSSGPEPPGARAAAQRPSEFRGKLDDAVAAFINDYPS